MAAEWDDIVVGGGPPITVPKSRELDPGRRERSKKRRAAVTTLQPIALDGAAPAFLSGRRSGTVFVMITKLLQHLMDDAASWPDEDQRELAAYARAISARRTGRYLVSDAERTALAEATGQADRGEFMSEAAVSAADRRHSA